MKINKFLPSLSIIVVIVLSYWSFEQIFIQGFFPMHDNTQVARVFEMGKVLKDGIFPVRWVPDLGYGYGYPLFNYYAPLAYYIGGFVNVLGFDALYSTKIMMGLGVLLSGITMYFFAKELFGKIGGILSALFYVYAPYHGVQIYVRGAVAEYFAYAFIPLIFLGLYKIFSLSLRVGSEIRWKTKFVTVLPWVIAGSIGYAGIILSHNLTAMMVTPLLLFFIVALSIISYQKQHQFTIYYLLFTLFLGILLSAFYWLPAILEMKYTNVTSQVGGSADFREHFVCLSQLWESQWGFGGSTQGCVDGISFKIGKLHFLAVLFSMLLILFRFINIKQLSFYYDDTYLHAGPLRPYRRNPCSEASKAGHYSEKLFMILFSILGFLTSIFFMVELSKPVWEAFSPMAFFQYPWRFLIFASFFSSLIAGTLPRVIDVFHMKKEQIATGKILLSVFVITLLLFTSVRIFQPQNIFQTNPSDFTNETALKWNSSKTSDEYMPKNFNKPATEEEIVKETIKSSPHIRVSNIFENSYSLSGTIEVLKPTTIVLKKAPFPSWELFIQGKKQTIEPTPDGYLLQMPPGVWSLHLKYQSTQIQQIANILSIAGVSFVIIGIIYLANQRKTIYFYEKTKS